MGQNRWWLKLFFYFLDVGTSNALVLHNYTTKAPLTVVDFKMAIVKTFLGDRSSSIPEVVVEHLPLRTEGRFQCVYCSMFSQRKQTRFCCTVQCCRLPLCSIGTGVTGQDCFTLCHTNKTIHEALVKYKSMKRSYTNQNKTH